MPLTGSGGFVPPLALVGLLMSLALFAVTRGKIHLQKRPLDAAALVARVVEGLRPSAQSQGHTGYEVARRLRQQPEGDSLLLVALTGYGQESDRQRSREAGFDFHFVKPVDLQRLLALLEARQEPRQAQASPEPRA
jgi:CheY-like chemotaxis protein